MHKLGRRRSWRSRRTRKLFGPLRRSDRFLGRSRLDLEHLETRALLAVVSGTFFTDLDGTSTSGFGDPDGIRTDADTGRINETVELYSSPGDVLMDTQVSDVDGLFQFDAVADGSYYLRFVEPKGAFFTDQDVGMDDTIDSDADPMDGTTAVFSVMGADSVSFDAGAVNEFSPAGFEYLLSQFGASLQNLLIQSEELEGSLGGVSLVGDSGIPFIEDALSGVVNFTSTFNEIGNQLFDSAELTLTSAPDVSFDLSADARLLVSLSGSDPVDVTVPMSMHTDIDGLITTVDTALATAGLGTEVVAGESDGNLTLSTVQNDLGTTLRVGTTRITAPNPAPAFGQPLADVEFVLTVDSIPTNLSLPATPTNDTDGNPLPTSQDNATPQDLADDLNELFANAGLTEIIAIVGTSDELVIAATGPEVSGLTIADDLDLALLGFAAASADTNQGALDLGFRDGLNMLVGGRAAAGFRYNSIESLIIELDAALQNVADPGTGVSLGAVFDEPTESLLFTLGFGQAYSAGISLDFSEGIDLGALGALEVAGGADASFAASATLDIRAGFDLSELGTGFTLTTATPLANLNSGEGVTLNVGITAEMAAPLDGQLGSDANVAIIIDGQPAVMVPVTAAATASNADQFALADDFNQALVDAGLDTLVSAGTVNDNGEKITLTAIDPTIRSLRVESASGLGFAAGGQDGNREDLQVLLKSGDSFLVNLDGAQTVGDVISAIEQQSMDMGSARVLVAINDDQLVLTDQTMGSETFEVKQPADLPGFPPIAGFGLGILKSADPATDDTIVSDTLHGQTLLDRFFIVADESGVSFDVEVDASNIGLTAALSFLEIGLENGTLDFDITTGIDFTDPDSSGRITLTELFGSPLADLFDLVPLTATGTAELPLSDSVFELVAPDYDTGSQNPAIEASLTASIGGDDLEFSLGANADLQTVFEDVIAQFSDFGVDDLIVLLSNLADTLLDSDLPLLNEEIPLIDQSIGDVIGFADSILDAVAELGTLMDVDDLNAAADALETAISNLTLTPLEKTDFDDTLGDMREAISGDEDRRASRVVSSAGRMQKLIDALPANTLGDEDLQDALQAFVTNVPAIDSLAGKLADILKDALGITDSDVFDLTLNFADYDDNTTAIEPALVLGFNYGQDFAVSIAPELNTGAFGPLSFEGNANLALVARPNFEIGIGLALAGGVTPFLMVNPTDPNLPTTSLGVEVGFTSRVDGEVQFGGLELVQAEGMLNLTSAEFESFTDSDLVGNDLTLSETPIDEALVLVAIAATASGPYTVLTNNVDYTVSGDVITFNTAPVGVIDVEYLSISTPGEPSMDEGEPPYDFDAEPDDRASLSIGFDQSFIPSDSNTIGAAPVTELFGASGPDFELVIDGLITAQLDASFLGNTQEDVVTLVTSFNHFDPQLTVDTEALTALFTELELDLQTIVIGTGALLDLLEEGLTSEVIAQLPVIGEGLDASGTFIGKLRDNLVTPLETLLENADDTLEAVAVAVRDEIFLHLNPLGIIRDQDDSGMVNEDDVFVTLTQENFEIELSLGGSDRISTGIDFDLGLDGIPLGVEANGGVDFGWDWQIDFGIGLSRDAGFYFLVNEDDMPEVRLTLDTGLVVDDSGVVPVPTSFDVDLFGLGLTATDNLNKMGDDGNTGVAGELTLDVKGFDEDSWVGEDDGRLTIQEIDDNSIQDIFTAGIAVDAVIDLGLAVEVSAALPSIEADLLVEFGVAFDTVAGLTFNAPTFALNDITLNLGDFLSNVIKPIVEDVDEAVEPIKPLIKFLKAEVPGISQLSQASGDGPVTVLDLAFIQQPAQGQAAKQFINVVDQILEVVALLNSFDEGDNIAINLGSFSVDEGDVPDLATNPNGLSSIDDTQLNGILADSGAVTQFGEVESQINSSSETKVKSTFGRINRSAGFDTDGGLGLELSIIQNPANVFKILLGQTADIIVWDIPVFALGFTFEKEFRPIAAVPPLTVTVGADFDFFADLTVGLDTRGLQTGNFLDGFFFGDLEGEEDIPEFGIGIGVRLRAALDLLVASAGIEGELRADIFANWNDQDDDGKLYGDELARIVQRDGIECIFNLTGELRAIVRLVWEVFGSEGSKEFINVLLFSFQNECPKIELGRVLEMPETMSDGSTADPGTLVLHAGPDASLRQKGVSSDTDEAFLITQIAPGVVKVEANGVEDLYSGVTSIYFDGGKGNDFVELVDEVGSGPMLPSILIGGSGDDELIGNTGIDVIRGGSGNDMITARDSDDMITGGSGMDMIDAGDGMDHIDAGDGADTVIGGDGDDTIIGGEGADIIDGGIGIDTIDGGAGNDDITGGIDGDIIMGGAGADMIVAGMGDDTVSGGSGNDTIFGGDGSDNLSGDSGNDFIQGDAGDDTLNGGLGSDALIGKLGSDTLLGGWGNDVILANDDSGPEGAGVTHYIEGGPDDDFICGDDGIDQIFGGTAEMGFVDVVANQALFPSSNGYSVSSCLEIPVFIANDPVTIQGQKFDDANQNGVRDAGETGINGWTIELYDEQNGLVDRAITGDVDLDGDGKIDPVTESGVYVFTAEPGSYTVREVVDPSWIQSFGGGVSVLDAAVHPITGLTYAITRDGLYTIDSTGVGTRLGSLGGARLNSIDFASNGTLYGMGYSDSALYSVNTGDGSTSPLFDTGFTSAGGLAHLDDVLYMTTGNRLVKLDVAMQTAEVIGAHGVGGMIALGVNADDDLIAARSATDTYVLNIFTGQATSVATAASGEFIEFGTLAFAQTVIVPPANISAIDYEVLLLSGQTVGGLDFGNYFAPATIIGQKFEDLDGDGVRDANELGLDGFMIQLYDAQGLLVGEATTASVDLNGDGEIDAFTEQGLYTFDNLDAGNYELVEVPQAGWVQSLPPMDGAIDVTVGNDEISMGNDFGNYRPVQIHGQKFEDLDGDGVRDPGELGLNGWTIQLFDNMGALVTTHVTMDMDLDGDGLIDPATESGLYWFTDLAPGTYMVSEVLQAGWVQTTLGGTTSTSQSVLYAVSTGLDGDGSSSLVRLDSFNDSPVAVEVGESGTLLTDVAIDPTSGRIFAIDYNRLYELDPGTGEATMIRALIGAPINALEFSDTGQLFVMGHDRLFTVNTDGTNQTTVFNTGVTSTGDLAYDSDGRMYLAAGQKLYRFDLTAGTFTLIGTHGIRALFGLEATGLGQFLIGGDETGRLHLINKATAEVQRLSFPSGNRNLGINGLTFDGTFFSAGAPGELDYTVTLFSGDVLDGADFGNQQTSPAPNTLPNLTSSEPTTPSPHLNAQDPTNGEGGGKKGLIRGVKFNDLNMNGVRDPEEPGLSDWQIFLDLNGDGDWDQMSEPGALTATNGSYAFADLLPGTYIVTEVQQLGWVQSAPAAGTYTVVVVSGTMFDNADFGNYQLDFNTIVDGDDTIFGLGEDDTIFGDNDTDALVDFGLVDGFDTISGGEGSDVMHGQGRDDIFAFETTAITQTDTVHELDGEGSDTLSFATLASGDPVTVNLTMDAIASHTNRTVNTGAAGQAAFFENIIGGLGNDSLTGNAADNRITGGDGDDTMAGLAGDDWYIFLTAGSGQTDTVTELSGEGTDRLDFQALTALDPVTVDLTNAGLATHTNRTVNTGAGLAANFEDVFGGAAGDTITGNTSANLLVGGPGADTISGNAGNDTIRGGGGDDTLEGGPDDDRFIIRRGDGSDTVTDSGGMDDEIDLTDMRLDLVFTVATGSFTVTDGFETLTHTGDTIDLVRSGRGDDQVVFTTDTASLIAQIDAGLGADLLDYTALSAAAGVTVNLDTGAADRTGGVVAFENVDGGAGADTITGDEHANLLRGFGGDDNIMGLAGNDVLEGGAGSDMLAGGEDDDLFVFVDPIMTENDGVVELPNEGDDTLDFSALTAGFGLTLDLTAAGAPTIHTNRTLSVTAGVNNVIGTTEADTILGNAASNRLVGGGGADTLGGRDGSDVLVGGADDDTYVFEDAASAQMDIVVESLGGGIDTLNFEALTTDVTFDMLIQSDLRAINLTIDMEDDSGADGTSFFEDILGSLNAVNVLKGNHVANVITGGPLGDTLEGRRGGDTLSGGDGDDTLRGGRGEDILRGGTDNDTLDGGPNQDRFVFDSENDGSDIVLENSGAVNTGNASGGGIDILDLSGVTTPVTFDLTMDMGTRATGLDVAFQTDDMMVMFPSSNVEIIIGSTAAANTLTGNDADNALTGGDVIDVLSGGDGADVLNGGDGDDTLGGGEGNDLLVGGAGNDQLSGDGGDDVLVYDANDVTLIDGGSGDDTLRFDVPVSLDLSTATHIVGIDHLDFLDTQVQSVDIEALDVPAASDAAILRISGGAEDAVTLRGTWSLINSSVIVAGRFYDEYQLADMSATVLVDQLISSVTLVPPPPIIAVNLGWVPPNLLGDDLLSGLGFAPSLKPDVDDEPSNPSGLTVQEPDNSAAQIGLVADVDRLFSAIGTNSWSGSTESPVLTELLPCDKQEWHSLDSPAAALKTHAKA